MTTVLAPREQHMPCLYGYDGSSSVHTARSHHTHCSHIQLRYTCCMFLCVCSFTRVYTFVLTVQAPLRAWVELVCRHDDLDETEMNRRCSLTSSSGHRAAQTVRERPSKSYWRVGRAGVATGVGASIVVLCQWPILEVVFARFSLTVTPPLLLTTLTVSLLSLCRTLRSFCAERASCHACHCRRTLQHLC